MPAKIAMRLIGVGILLFLLWYFDAAAVAAALRGVSIPHLLAAFLCGYAVVTLRAARWRALARYQGFDYRFGRFLGATLSSYFISIVTPGRIGEFGKALLVGAETRAGAVRLTVSVVLDRLWDIAFMLGLGVPVLAASSDRFGIDMTAAYVSLVAATALIVLAFGLWRLSLRWRIWKRMADRFGIADVPGLAAEARRVFGGKILSAVMWTTASWGLLLAMAWLFAASLGLTFSLLYILLFLVAGMLASLLPVTVGGVGTRDGIYVYCFMVFGYTAEEAISFSLLFLLMHMVFAVTGCGLYFFAGFSIRIPPKEETNGAGCPGE